MPEGFWERLMKENEKNTGREKAGMFELNDEALDAVVGGTDGLDRRITPITPEFSDFLCTCTACNNDTLWAPYGDGDTVFCTACGAEKDRAWFDNNKVRKRGIAKII